MLLSKNAMYALLKRIAESGGMTEDMEKDFQRLKDDFDEREGILKKYGEEYDGENEEYEFKEREEYNRPRDLDSEHDVDYWRTQAESYRRRYIDRFFGSDESLIEEEKERSTEVFDETEKNIETYDELLRKDDE